LKKPPPQKKKKCVNIRVNSYRILAAKTNQRGLQCSCWNLIQWDANFTYQMAAQCPVNYNKIINKLNPVNGVWGNASNDAFRHTGGINNDMPLTISWKALTLH